MSWKSKLECKFLGHRYSLKHEEHGCKTVWKDSGNETNYFLFFEECDVCGHRKVVVRHRGIRDGRKTHSWIIIATERWVAGGVLPTSIGGGPNGREPIPEKKKKPKLELVGKAA